MAKKRPNKVERERLKTIGEMPCYACFQDGRETIAITTRASRLPTGVYPARHSDWLLRTISAVFQMLLSRFKTLYRPH